MNNMLNEANFDRNHGNKIQSDSYDASPYTEYSGTILVQISDKSMKRAHCFVEHSSIKHTRHAVGDIAWLCVGERLAYPGHTNRL